jgi:ribonuclease R
MLPEVLSADVCSLRAGEDRAAMACHLEIAASGKVTVMAFHPRTGAHSPRNIAYEEAQRRIDDGEAGEHLVNLWACWRRWSRPATTAIRWRWNCPNAAWC